MLPTHAPSPAAEETTRLRRGHDRVDDPTYDGPHRRGVPPPVRRVRVHRPGVYIFMTSFINSRIPLYVTGVIIPVDGGFSVNGFQFSSGAAPVNAESYATT